MRGMSVDNFLSIKDIFVKQLRLVRDSINLETDQERSIFSLETQKDIFL